MFQMMLFVGSIVSLIIGGLIILIGIGAITGCAGGLMIMCAGGIIAFVGAWSALAFLLPAPEMHVREPQTVNLIKRNGKWV